MLVCGTGKRLCDILLFKNDTPPFNAQTVRLVQDNLITKQEAKPLCRIFPVVRTLELDFDYISYLEFLSCSFDLLDELIVGEKLMDRKNVATFELLLKKNARIQRLTLKGQSNHHTYALIEKYLNNLLEVTLLDSVVIDEIYYQDYPVVIPSVRKLVMKFSAEVGCNPPTAVMFGGFELQDLHLECDGLNKNEKFFNTLRLYGNITSLYAGRWLLEHEVSEMVQNFPNLLTAKLMIYNTLGDSLAQFVKNCTNLQQLIVDHSNRTLTPEWKESLENLFGDEFTVSSVPLRSDGTPFDYTFRVTSKNYEPNGSSALTFVTSGLVSYLIGIHICRGFFF